MVLTITVILQIESAIENLHRSRPCLGYREKVKLLIPNQTKDVIAFEADKRELIFEWLHAIASTLTTFTSKFRSIANMARNFGFLYIISIRPLGYAR